MTTTFIVGYIVLAVILVGLVNVLVLKSRKKRKNQAKGQHVNEESKSQSNPSKFKISDLDRDKVSNRTQDSQRDDDKQRHMNSEDRHIENDKRKNHFENEQDQQDHASEQIHPEQKQASHSLHYSDDATEDDKQDDDVNNQHLPKDSIYEPINPDSQEGRVNERIKKQKEDFVFGEGITRNKILATMLFGMFIAILNQTLLNVALPKINTEFNISASTGQWLMTGFMLVNGILIPISAFLFNKYSYRKLFIIALLLFTIGSLVCALSNNFPMMMGGRVLQAIGAGVLMPLGSNVIVTIFPPEKRGVAMGTMGIAMILAPAIGPTLSGYIVQNYHWNVMFYGMFFLGILCNDIWLFLVQIVSKNNKSKSRLSRYRLQYDWIWCTIIRIQ